MRIKSLPPSKRLDYVLTELQKLPNKNYWRKFDELCEEIAVPDTLDELRENRNQISAILIKLVKDGYVFRMTRETDTFDYVIYDLTFEGEALLETEGGYSGRLEKENRAYVLGIINERNTRFGVVGAAVFAGGILIWDIVKFLLDKNQIVVYLFLLLVSSLVYRLVKKFP